MKAQLTRQQNLRRYVGAAIGALALLGLGYALFAEDLKIGTGALAAPVAESVAKSVDRFADVNDTTSPPNANGDDSTLAAVNAAENREDSPLSVPAPGQVLAEARDNAHQTPSSLIAFAHELAEPMSRATQSEAAAHPFFARLEICAGANDQAIQARVVCLANAARLAEIYPDSLGRRYQELMLKNPALVSILDTTGI